MTVGCLFENLSFTNLTDSLSLHGWLKALVMTSYKSNLLKIRKELPFVKDILTIRAFHLKGYSQKNQENHPRFHF